MDKKAMTAAILEAKAAKGLSWEAIAGASGLHPVFVCSACLGENSLGMDEAVKTATALDLGEDVAKALTAFPYKGTSQDRVIPTDPLIYRFYEIMIVYGDTLKAIIHENFGDGIMSAIDFTMDVEKVEDPKGDRVKVTMNGKFLPYKKW